MAPSSLDKPRRTHCCKGVPPHTPRQSAAALEGARPPLHGTHAEGRGRHHSSLAAAAPSCQHGTQAKCHTPPAPRWHEGLPLHRRGFCDRSARCEAGGGAEAVPRQIIIGATATQNRGVFQPRQTPSDTLLQRCAATHTKAECGRTGGRPPASP